MENFKPSEEQLFDYFCDDLDDNVLQGKVAAYLQNHPELARELADWKTLETTYNKALTANPTARALENVKQTALTELKKPVSFWDRLAWPVTAKKFAVSFSVLFLAATTFALTRLWIPTHPEISPDLANKSGEVELQTSHLASTVEPGSANVAPTTNAELQIWAEQEFANALMAYQQNDLDLANQKFLEITSRYPQFSENPKLYTYWIESLKKQGQFEQAAEKKAVLDQLEAKP